MSGTPLKLLKCETLESWLSFGRITCLSSRAIRVCHRQRTKRNSQFCEEIVYNSKISSFATNLFAR